MDGLERESSTGLGNGLYIGLYYGGEGKGNDKVIHFSVYATRQMVVLIIPEITLEDDSPTRNL